MPFEGLARSVSQEHEQAAASFSRQDRIDESGSTHSTATLAEEKDLEARGESKEKSEKGKEVAVEEVDPFLVTLEGREQLSPHSWGDGYRWFLTALAGLLVLNSTFASSAPSNLIPAIIAHFDVSQLVGVLTIALFVAGFTVGPLFWGPLSERYGRRRVFLIAFLPYTGFQVGCALSPNIGSLLAFKSIRHSGGVIADLWDADRRGKALAIFALMPFAGPAIAPIVAGYMFVTDTNWRWIFWLLTIFAGLCFVAILVLLPETYVPYILHMEAKRLRKETGDNRWHSAIELAGGQESLTDILNRSVLKPFRMIAQESMLLVITAYMSFVYAILYLLFVALPIIFIQGHGLNAGEAGLVFLALPVGGIISVLTYIFKFNRSYVREHHRISPRPVPPEFRLKPLLWAAPAFAFSFFWLGWTSYPSISIASPILSLVLLGASILLIFLSCFNYLIDTYLANAASALSINTVARSTLGAAFPLFAAQMYERLGTPGATSLLGGLAILFIPVPLILIKYGRRIRAMSKNAVVRPGEEE